MKFNKKADFIFDLMFLIILIYLCYLGYLSVVDGLAQEDFEEICIDLGYNNHTDHSSIRESNIMIECDNVIIENITIYKKIEIDKWGKERETSKYWYKEKNETLK